ncbi:MAG TPA: thiamine-phosphate kinase [Pseudomonadales bacterium]|nr:thiamine-phosphate kinase [Pseudomonadales bacterium]
MAIAEFALIERYFKQAQPTQRDLVLGIGDDAALVTVPAGQQLCVAVDTLVAGVHFPHATSAFDIGYKALAVNLSDMAAMGACPRWFTLALTLPNTDEQWLKEFSAGLFALATQHDLALIGGDTTAGPLTISIQILGLLPLGHALLRSGAQIGDDIYVSGSIGDAGLTLRLLQKKEPVLAAADRDFLLERLNRPTARVKLGQALLPLAHAAIDISDGLLVDLSHILTRSQCGARLWLDKIPLSQAYVRGNPKHDSTAKIMNAACAGDDYELCFTAPSKHRAALTSLSQDLSLPLTRIGEIIAEQGLFSADAQGRLSPLQARGFEHFA